MSDLDDKREEIAALIADELGLGAPDTLSPSDRTVVDRQTAETIEGCDADAAEPEFDPRRAVIGRRRPAGLVSDTVHEALSRRRLGRPREPRGDATNLKRRPLG